MLSQHKRKSNASLHLLILPSVILLFVYSYIPMAGLIAAFKKYDPFKGFLRSEWVGFANFRYILAMPDMGEILWNTVFIAVMKIVAGLVVPVIIAILLNESVNTTFKKVVQTTIYFPYFLSWVILGGIVIDILSPSTGIVNQFLSILGIQPIYFLGNEQAFPYVLVATDLWKNFGFSTIVYLAALTGIDPSLYEACAVDGGSRWKQTLNITLPGIASVVILMATLSLGNVLNAGFEQVFNLYSPQVYRTGDIIDTFIYRLGMIDKQYSPAIAVGFFKSVVSFVLILTSHRLASRYANYRIF